MGGRKRAWMGGPVVVIGLVLAATIAIAQDPAQDSQAPAASSGPERIPFEEQKTFRAGVPDDPYIDFCPTPEQVEAFAERTGGLDLKPRPPRGMGCSSKGAWLPPDSPHPDDPVDQLSEQEECEHLKEELLSATPLPKGDDPRKLDGRRPDGSEFGLIMQGSPEHFEDTDIHDFARGLGC